MKAVVVLADGFEEVEAVTPIDLLRRAGVTVTIAGLDNLMPMGARGVTIRCDAMLSEVTAWDALILPGGLPGARRLAASALVDQKIQETFSNGARVAAICAAPVLVLGSRGYLKGRSFTGYPGTGEAELSDADYKLDAVVVDGQLVTSRGVATATEFALKLVELLAGIEKRDEVAKATLLV